MNITFPAYSGIRCLMMPYVQGDPDSVPDEYDAYEDIISSVYLDAGEIGFLTIDESPVESGKPHRAAHAKFDRALHTEAGLHNGITCWGTPYPAWGAPPTPQPQVPKPKPKVILDWDLEILLANNITHSCALWNAEHTNTSEDGDIGDKAHLYPYEDAIFMNAGDVHRIGIFTPHESMPIDRAINRQFLRVVGSGVLGRESYFTENPLIGLK